MRTLLRTRTALSLTVTTGLLGAVACSTSGGSPGTSSSASASSSHALAIPELQLSPAPWSPLVAARATADRTVDAYVVLHGPAAGALLPRGFDVRASEALVTRFRKRVEQLSELQATVRPQLEARGALVVASFKKAGNAFHVRVPASRIAELSRIPEVDRVEPVPIYSRSTGNGVPAMGVPEVWARTAPLDGDGITIGIVDTGIDYIHADFGGSGSQADYQSNDSTIVESGSFPTARVVGGTDFAGDDYNGSNSPSPDDDPLDCVRDASGGISGGHGTHVAGIAAGNGVLTDGTAYSGPYDTSLDPSQFTVYPGAAPKALLHAIRVFGCDGGTGLTGSAYEYAIDPNGDNDPSDRLDVVNASLGSDFGVGAGFQGTLIRNLTNAGSLFVAAAGNAGSSFFIAGNPAGYPEAVSVAATAEAPLPQVRITAPSSVAGNYNAVDGAFTAGVPTTPISGDFVVAQPSDACADISNDVSGKIVIIDRGTCLFQEKLERAETAGAIAAVVVQNSPNEPPFPMGGQNPVGIPGVMIGSSDGTLLKSASGLQGSLVALEGQSQLSPFSSRGPSAADGSFKPEVAAPGSNVRSAGVGTGTEAVTLSGTSMASPMAAGAAALIRQAHPTWAPLEVKAAMLSTGGPTTTAGVAAPVSHVGAGLVRAPDAIDTMVFAAADPSASSGVSFGVVSSAETTTVTRRVKITNKGTDAASYDLSAELTFDVAGLTVRPTVASITVAGGSSETVDLELEFDPTQLKALQPDPATPATVRLGADQEYGRHFLVEAAGKLILTSTTSGVGSLSLPFHGSLRPSGDRELAASGDCIAANSTVDLEISGSSTLDEPAMGIFELGEVSDTVAQDPSADIAMVGAATDLASRDFADASAFIALVMESDWTTPAPNSFQALQQGFPGRFIVEIDADRDGQADFNLVAVAFNDVLISVPLGASGNQGQPRFLNIVPADVLNTQPYFNRVAIFPVFLEDLALAPGNAVFDYRVVAIDGTGFGNSGDSTNWVTFDAENPKVDASPHGIDGRPLFSANESPKIDVNADDASALILHFDNEPTKRAQVLELAPTGATSNLAVVASGPDDVDAEDTATVEITVTNAGAERGAVKLSATVTGGEVSSAETSAGTCTTDGAVSCDLGDLAADATVTVTLSLAPGADSEALDVDATVTGSEGCGDVSDDDTDSVSVSVTGGDSSGTGSTAEGGGCGCSTPGDSAPSRSGWLLGGLLGAALLRRRRR